jgi:hypothetical protein
MIDETYAASKHWDFEEDKSANLNRLKDENLLGAKSANWARDVAFVLSRRFDLAGRDQPLVRLAQAGCEREVWKPILLYHMTRDEFLFRDFLVNWQCSEFMKGMYRLHTNDVINYLESLHDRNDIELAGKWTDSTTSRVASGLLRMATDFDLLMGTKQKEFASYYLPEESFLYLLHALTETEPNARRMMDSEDWRMYLMDASDVERELLRLHQYRRVHYEAAGTLVQLKLPHESLAAYTEELCA